MWVCVQCMLVIIFFFFLLLLLFLLCFRNICRSLEVRETGDRLVVRSSWRGLFEIIYEGDANTGAEGVGVFNMFLLELQLTLLYPNVRTQLDRIEWNRRAGQAGQQSGLQWSGLGWRREQDWTELYCCLCTVLHYIEIILFGWKCM